LAWRFRKSARLPLGFRLNASKSGLGFSWGFRGFRIGRDAKGRTVRTLSIPGTGVFNRQVISTARSRATFVTVNSRGIGYQRRTENLEPALEPQNDPQLQLDSVFHVPVSELAASNQSEFVARLNDNVSAFNPGPVLIVLSVFALLLVLSNFILGLVLFFLGLGLGIFVSKRFAESHTEEINFSLDQDSAEKFRGRQQALSVLASCARIWVVNTSASNADAKRNAGAHTLITRGPAAVGNLPTRGFKCSLPILSIRANNIVLHFLPDQILIFSGRYVSISYAQLFIEVRSTRFSETEPIPGDSRKVDTTWLYVNKSGGPDRRFNSNRQIPVLEYGEVTFRTATGLEMSLQTSNSEKAKAFAGQFSAVLPNNTMPSIADGSSYLDRSGDLRYEVPYREAFHGKAEREAAGSNLPSRLEPGQHQDPPLASPPSSVPFPNPIPLTRSNPVEMPLPPLRLNPQPELHPMTSTELTLSSLKDVSKGFVDAIVELLKTEMSESRQSSMARDYFEQDLRAIIIHFGCTDGKISRDAAHLYLELFSQMHPRTYSGWSVDNSINVLQEIVQKNLNFYIGGPVRPYTLAFIEKFDGAHGTNFKKTTCDFLMAVAIFASAVDGKVSDDRTAGITQLKATLEQHS
jgi:hypothetical protein